MDNVLKAHLQAANSLYREGRFSEAEADYLQVQELEPTNTEALTRLGEIALWKNRPQQAERYFKEALDAASGLQKRWPFNTQLKSSLAMAYYRQDCFPQAAQCFHDAAGPISVGPFRDLKALESQLALFGSLTPYYVEGPEVTHIQFSVTDPLPVVEVSINGSQLVPFFIDTGGAEIILDTAFAEEVGAVHAGALSGEGGGTKGAIGLGKVDRMRIGDFIIQNIPIHILDTTPFAAVFDGLPVKGVIGTRLLMHFLATIDYQNACLILRRPTHAAELETSTAKVIPFWLIQTHYIVAWGTVNGRALTLFFVDTGLAGKAFTAPESVLRDAGIEIDWTKAEQGIAGFGENQSVDVSIEQLTLGSDDNEVIAHNVPGIALTKPLEVLGSRLGFTIGGAISHQFFRDYALTLDFVGMRLILQK
jgi:predicted aspartyl protease